MSRWVIGIPKAKAYYSTFLTGFSNIKFEIKEMVGQGNKLTKHWVFSGKHTGDFFGVAPTDKSLAFSKHRSRPFAGLLLNYLKSPTPCP